MAKSHAGSSPAIGIIFFVVILMKSDLIKLKFLEFFKRNGYKEVDEAPLIPLNDESLLFTNSGMVQFKNIFLGLERYRFEKVITSQTCVRLGGKHNDIDTIGTTLHHNTSFTMLGYFCFNEASKTTTILLAWKFLIEILELDKDKIYITVHKNDHESYSIWKNLVNIMPKKIKKGNDKTNFWSMDDVGPCGFCSEIFYDIGTEDLNLLEIWNLVFIQFNKKNNELHDLKNLFIDTGMGLERIASIKQNVFNNFETDILKPLVFLVLDKFNLKTNDLNVKIIVDHFKTSIILIKNGVIPLNDGRGYILKKLIRRAIIKKIDLNIKNKLCELTEDFILNIYKESNLNQNDVTLIKKIIKQEEEKFEHTLKNGILFLKNKLKNSKEISGKMLYSLYDTYGLPIDIIKTTFKDENIILNIEDFNNEMKKSSIHNKKKSIEFKNNRYFTDVKNTEFVGYSEFEIFGKIIKIINKKESVQKIGKNETAVIILEKTCFYAEKGGQVGDIGLLINGNNNIFYVNNTTEVKGIYFHHGYVLEGVFYLNDDVLVRINYDNRKSISINHSATHLLHAVLKKILGQHVKQSGSLINNEYLRFDFVHFSSLLKEELFLIEKTVNSYIKRNLKLEIEIIDSNLIDREKNRIVSFGKNVSKEFCAGTHVNYTSEIGLFKIIKESGIGANIRRIEAITSDKILELLNKDCYIFEELGEKLLTNKDNLLLSIKNLIDENNNLKKENYNIMLKEIKSDLYNEKNRVIKEDIVIIKLEKEKKYIKFIKNFLIFFKKTIIIIFSFEENFINLNINVSNDLSSISALSLLNYLKNNFDLKGGGNANIANGTIFCDDIVKVFCFIDIFINKNIIK